MTINLKIEIVKIFKLEFELSSDKIMKKKESKDEEITVNRSTADNASKGK